MIPRQNYNTLVAKIKAKIETFKAKRKEEKKKYASPHESPCFLVYHFSNILASGCFAA